MDVATGEASVTPAQKVTRELLFNPAVTLLGLYPEEMKAGSQKDTWTACSQQYSSQWLEETEVSTNRQKDGRCGGHINQNIIQPFYNGTRF